MTMSLRGGVRGFCAAFVAVWAALQTGLLHPRLTAMIDTLGGDRGSFGAIATPSARRERRGRIWVCALVGALLGCSSPLLSRTNFTCASDRDCASGEVCAPFNGARACQASTGAPIRVGTSGPPLTGPRADLGQRALSGLEALFERVNAAGGVHGRQLEIDFASDDGDPALAAERVRELIDVREVVSDPNQPDVRGPDGVFALLGPIGDEAALAAASVASKNRIVAFGPMSGAQARLRDGTLPYVYNYRAGLHEERLAFLDYASRGRIPAVLRAPATDFRRLVVLAPRSQRGDAAYGGVVRAFEQQFAPLPSPTAIARVGFERDDVQSVDAAVEETERLLSQLLASGTAARESAAIMMVDAGRVGGHYVRALRNWVSREPTRAQRLDLVFSHPSLGGEQLIEALQAEPASYVDGSTGASRRYVDDVLVTQVVPHHQSQAPAIARYRDDMRSYGDGTFSFGSLEGYIVAMMFVQALEQLGPDPTTDGLAQVLDGAGSFHAGIGAELSFSPSDHQASDVVWGTELDDSGEYEVRFVWRRDDDMLYLTRGEAGGAYDAPPIETSEPCSVGEACLPSRQPNCFDDERNGSETDLDCGGSCGSCLVGQLCAQDADCATAHCEGGVCAPAACDDGRINGLETAVDCGGNCEPCGEGSGCVQASDCGEGLACADAPGVCTQRSCSDGLLNGSEVEVDCGGSCPGCSIGAACRESDDCQTGVCGPGGCSGDLATCCQAPRCDDGVLNGSESSLDCGDAPCEPCVAGSPCESDSQCRSNECVGGICELPSCVDGVVNGSETDVDCGGPDCPGCGAALRCTVSADCQSSGGCEAGVCSSCGDGLLNGTETGLDCGGQCGATCPDGAACNQDDDCAGSCLNDICCNANGNRCSPCLLSGRCQEGPNEGIAECLSFFQCATDHPEDCQAGTDSECSGSGAPCDAELFGGSSSPGMRRAIELLRGLGC